MLPLDLVRAVVCFLDSREEREALGYDVDRCIREHVPPLPLRVHPFPKARLRQLHEKQAAGKCVRVYYPAERVLVTITFRQDLERVCSRVQTGVYPNARPEERDYYNYWNQVSGSTTADYGAAPLDGVTYLDRGTLYLLGMTFPAGKVNARFFMLSADVLVVE